MVNDKVDRFMDNGYAKLEQGNSWITIDAPHLDFKMAVMYIDKGLMASFTKQHSEDETVKQKATTNAL